MGTNGSRHPRPSCAPAVLGAGAIALTVASLLSISETTVLPVASAVATTQTPERVGPTAALDFQLVPGPLLIPSIGVVAPGFDDWYTSGQGPSTFSPPTQPRPSPAVSTPDARPATLPTVDPPAVVAAPTATAPPPVAEATSAAPVPTPTPETTTPATTTTTEKTSTEKTTSATTTPATTTSATTTPAT